MTNYRRNFVAGGSYFFTVNLAERNGRLLTEHVNLLRAAFRYTRARHSFAIEAIVVPPDHLHTIWTLPEDDANFATRWRLIKATFSRACRQASGFPQAVCKKGNAVFGSGAIGSTLCVTRTTSRGTRITFTSIP